MRYKGAAIQYDCHFMDKEKNLAALTNLVRQAAAQGAKLIVLPEMCATGYYFESMEQAAEMASVSSLGGKTLTGYIQRVVTDLAGGCLETITLRGR